MTKLRLDVVSDVVCPWCWLGKRRLDAALAQVPDLDVEVTFRPYELDPEVPAQGVGYRQYMTSKFGDLSRLKEGQARLLAAGADVGIVYRFDEIPVRPNTVNAHRLIRWAHGQGKGSETVEALFHAHFTELRDIGDKAALADIAGEVGLDHDAIAHLLSTDQDENEVRREENFFRGLGVNAVPTFIGNGRTAVQGAHETEALVRFLRAASAMTDTRMA
jgi:predicted DsbA family dithiol-disulfide isomerase